MKPYHKNPRQITAKQFEDLGQWLYELGDLSGITHDISSDEIITGNQRGRAIDINECEIVVEDEYAEPDRQGTVARGYIIWQGMKYNYRRVDWTPEQCEKANIVANKAGGAWDFDILANEFELDELIGWGFEDEMENLKIAAETTFGDGGNGNRGLGARAKTMSPVIPIEDISIIESALRSTGETNRGVAFVKICKAYLNEKGQFDFSFEV